MRDAAARCDQPHGCVRSSVGRRSRCRWGWRARPAARPRVRWLPVRLRPRSASSWKRCAAVGRARQHGSAVGGAHEMAVARVAGVGHQHLVARLDQRQAGQLQGRRGACGDHDAAGRRPARQDGCCVPGGDAPRARPAGRVASVYWVRPSAAWLRSAAPCTSGGAVKSGSPMFRKTMGAVGCGGAPGGQARRRLGHLHHVEGLDALGAPGDPHGCADQAAPVAGAP